MQLERSLKSKGLALLIMMCTAFVLEIHNTRDNVTNSALGPIHREIILQSYIKLYAGDTITVECG